MPEFAKGGYVEGPPVPVFISPDECCISAEDAKARRFRCSRSGHPTSTSDCSRPRTLSA